MLHRGSRPKWHDHLVQQDPTVPDDERAAGTGAPSVHTVGHELRRLRTDVRRFAFHAIFNVVLGSAAVPRLLRTLALRALGVPVARSANIWPHVLMKSRRLVVGRGVMVNEGVRFANTAEVRLGDGVAVGQEVLFLTETHVPGGPGRRAGADRFLPIEVGDGAWIGARATVLPGVRIGPGTVIAAGAVVVADCAPHSVYGGVPARYLRPAG